MIIIKHYTTANGASPFAKWFNKLDATQREKVATAIVKLQTNLSVDRKDLKRGFYEVKVRAGGLRIYFAEDGDEIIILLGGGQKDNHSRDIENARNRLADYLVRKEQENGSTPHR